METHKEYTVRSGTVNFGKEYEFKVTALLLLRCVLEAVEDFWCASNANGVGVFDDIILQVKRRNSDTVTFMMQLKQQTDPKNITEKDFVAPTGEYFLAKFFKDINTLHEGSTSSACKNDIVGDVMKSSKVYFVLYTNRGLTECKILDKYHDNGLDLVNTGAILEDTYRFINIRLQDGISLNTSNAHNNMYLLPNQLNVNELDKRLGETIQKVTKMQSNITKIAQDFVKYVTAWANGSLGGHYYITKEDVLFRLTDMVLSYYQLNIRQELFIYYDCDQKRIWNDIVANKTITIIESDEIVSTFLIQYIAGEVAKYCKNCRKSWGEPFSAKQEKLFYKENSSFTRYLMQAVSTWDKITLLEVYKCIWRTGKLPMLLEFENISDYKIVVNILKKSNNCYKVLVLNKRIAPFLEKSGKKNRFETLSDLQEDHRKKMLQQSVKLQERGEVLLGNLIDESMYSYLTCKDIIHILSGNFNIGDQLAPIFEYFIRRKVIKTAVKCEFLKQIINEIIIIEGVSDSYIDTLTLNKSRIHKIDEVNFDKVKELCGIVTSQKNTTMVQIGKLLSARKPMHILSVYDEKYLDWKWSYGSTKVISRFAEVHEYDIKTVVEKQLNNVNIISAEPGMGKSILMDYIAHQIPTNRWVLRIDLNKFQHYFKHIDSKSSQMESLKHLRYFFSAYHNGSQGNSNISQAVFEKQAKKNEVVVLLDGFDEISVSYKNEVTSIAKSLMEAGYCTWITTRPIMKNHLEETLKSYCFTIKPFSVNDQEEFLLKYFTSTCQELEFDVKSAIAEQFVKVLLKAARKNLNSRDAEFTGIPLQTKLLADVFSSDFKESLRQDQITINTNFDLLHLYENFVGRKIDILEQRYGEAIRIMHMVVKEHQLLFALKLVFPLDDLVDVNVLKKMYGPYSSRPEIILLVEKDGIITVDQNLNVSSTHRTFAEYLAAEWLSENITSTDDQLRKVSRDLIHERFTRNYNFLFSMFDRILAKDAPVHRAIICGEVDNARNMVQDNFDIAQTDKGGRSIVHLTALYGRRFPEYLEHFPEKETNDKMLAIIDAISGNLRRIVDVDVMGYTPLDYALANFCMVVANKVISLLAISKINIALKLQFEETYIVYSALMSPKLYIPLLCYFVTRNLLLKNVNPEIAVDRYLGKYIRNVKDFTIGAMYEYKDKDVLQFLKLTVYSNCFLHTNSYFPDLRFAASLGEKSNVADLLEKGAEIDEQDVDKNAPLHYAVLHGRVEIVKVLLSKGASLHKQNNKSNTPLHVAVLECHTKIVKLLLSRGADVNLPNIDHNTALHLVGESYKQRHVNKYRFEKMAILKLLRSKGANTDARNKKGENVLHCAASVGFDNIVVELLNAGCKVNAKDYKGNTPLHLAATNGHVGIARLLIENGADILAKNEVGETALYLSLLNSHVNMVEYLIEAGADVEAKGDNLVAPLHLAIDHRLLTIVNLLLSKGATVNAQNGEGDTPLHVAITQSHLRNEKDDYRDRIDEAEVYVSGSFRTVLKKQEFNVIGLLISKGVEFNIQNQEGNTVLHLALKYECEDIAYLLIRRGAVVNVQNNNGDSPLHLALNDGRPKIAELLLRKGAMFQMQNEDGDTPLHLALKKGFPSISEVLISKGATVTIKDKKGTTPLHLASKRGYLNITESLIKNGAIVNVQNRLFDTPLLFAVKSHSLDVVELLIKEGAEVNFRNGLGFSPLHQAVQRSLSIVQLLIDNDAVVNTANIFGDTPLHAAAKKGDVEIVQLVLKQGAIINKANRKGVKPLDLAVIKGHSKIVELLQT